MFNKDFFPTPEAVIIQMLEGFDINKKIVLDPEGGKGDIVDYCFLNGASDVISCEINQDLKKILATKCKVIADDFLTVTSDQISHIDFIIMNPPFSADEKHINHAWEIAPAGCHIIALCNLQTIKNPYSKGREKLNTIIEENGSWSDLGDCFRESERETGVEVGLIRIQKPGSNYNTEFEGFFMGEDEQERQENGIMSYNVVRDLVNRYVQAMKIFDEQANVAVKMNDLMSGYFGLNKPDLSLAFSRCTVPLKRNEFKKEIQKDGWKFIFAKMNMQKYATRGLRDDINKFVEKQTDVPFTMKNIYKMLEMVVGTQESRMDKAILEVFDKLTHHYDENRYNVEGWKTNSHYLINEKFILPNMCAVDKWNKNSSRVQTNYGGCFDLVEDMMKALCFITGDNYDNFINLDKAIRYRYKVFSNGKYIDCANDLDGYSGLQSIKNKLYEAGKPIEVIDHEAKYGEWFDWGYFEIKAFKKGTVHFKFKDSELWGKFNQRVAKIKGYPLYEHVKTKTQEPAKQATKSPAKPDKQAKVLFEIKLAS